MPDQDKMAKADPLVGVAETIDDVTAVSVAEHRKAMVEEYGEYVATSAITHAGARAYNIGDPVPAANVKRWKYDELGLVARRSTKAGQRALGVVEESVEDPAPSGGAKS